MQMLPRLLALLLLFGSTVIADTPKPLRALLIAGGCCHDYENQKRILTEGISARVPIVWTVVHDVEMVDGKDTAAVRDHLSSVYAKENWAEGYDVVVHDECYGEMKDPAMLARITKPHSEGGVPAVFLHCSVHSYRKAADADANLWRDLLGSKSMYHEAAAVLTVKPTVPQHPVMAGFPAEFVTPEKDELYIIEKLWDTATVLATSHSDKLNKENPVVWVNEAGKVRSFSTSLGHSNPVVASSEYLELVSRGILWVTGRLQK